LQDVGAQKQLFAQVFDLYATLPIDYVDAYHAALLLNRDAVSLYSFDADFDRVPGLRRQEPS